jgi:peptidoglycan hydrolase CwlO-like protein
MKNKNVFTYAAVAGVIIITIFALYQSTNAPDSDISDKDNQIIDTQDSYI